MNVFLVGIICVAVIILYAAAWVWVWENDSAGGLAVLVLIFFIGIFAGLNYVQSKQPPQLTIQFADQTVLERYKREWCATGADCIENKIYFEE